MNPSTTASNTTTRPTRLTIGDYAGKVLGIQVLPFGDRPVIFTAIGVALPGAPENAPLHRVTHAVRMNNPDALRIGLSELRLGFPNILGHLSDKDVIKAMNRKAVLDRAVTVSIVPQLKNGIQVKLDNGEPAYNVRLRSVEAITDDTLDTILDKLTAPKPAAPESDPFHEPDHS